MRSIEEWTQQATGHIRFAPDRKVVAEELRAAYEDHRDALLEAGERRERASFLALQALGDPDEAGELLSKVHTPYLGWAWRASRWVLLAACILLFIALVRIMWGDLPNGFYRTSMPYPVSEVAKEDSVYSIIRNGSSTDAVRSGSYTFRVEESVIIQHPNGNLACILLQVRCPFWLDKPNDLPVRLFAYGDGRLYENYLTSETPHAMTGWMVFDGPVSETFLLEKTLGVQRYWVTLCDVPEDLAQAEICYDHGGTRFSLTVHFGEGS
ncbi:MAG: hypothetical protein IKW92_04740 [Firmicutes bacterium]|nr:hypothetical protein [Bacillota bacterium]